MFTPWQWAQTRIDQWVLRRVQRTREFTITRNRVYILPTRFGWLFALMLVAMLLGAMNYSNSMAFLLTFLLAGLGLIAMHHTHANLAGVGAQIGHCAPVFAGQTATFEIVLVNRSGTPRPGLSLGWHDAAVQVRADLPAQTHTALKLTLPAATRGWLRAGTFCIASDYPLGLFHAWTWAELDMQALVYPQPAAHAAPRVGTVGQGHAQQHDSAGSDEFAGLRSYRPGDAPRAIHWKSLPKLTQPMVKTFAQTRDEPLWLDWFAPSAPDVEQRLSQLTRAVLDAEAAQRSYGLKLPTRELPPARGAQHRHACLHALALFGTPA